jgi:hypothetical protein
MNGALIALEQSSPLTTESERAPHWTEAVPRFLTSSLPQRDWDGSDTQRI